MSGASDESEEEGAKHRRAVDGPVVEHGLEFRRIPGGPFLMGSTAGDPDERPVHRVRLSEFWISSVPVSWELFCRLMDWEPPPAGHPKEIQTLPREHGWNIDGLNRIRVQYCEDATIRARDWHAHVPSLEYVDQSGAPLSGAQIFGEAERTSSERPYGYRGKPMVAIAWQDAESMCERISDERVEYRLPTEAEWEKAARGGLEGALYPWGDEPATPERCDCERFEQFGILPSRTFRPNGYGLYAMAGGVWEWTRDAYDARAYGEGSERVDPRVIGEGERALRGGSWADCGWACRVSARMSLSSSAMEADGWGRHATPTIGFRIVRVLRGT